MRSTPSGPGGEPRQNWTAALCRAWQERLAQDETAEASERAS